MQKTTKIYGYIRNAGEHMQIYENVNKIRETYLKLHKCKKKPVKCAEKYKNVQHCEQWHEKHKYIVYIVPKSQVRNILTVLLKMYI